MKEGDNVEEHNLVTNQQAPGQQTPGQQAPVQQATGTGDEAPPLTPPGIALAIAVAPQINFACQQNAVPVIREIELINHSAQAYRGLTLEMRAAPAFLAVKQWHIDSLLESGRLHINDRDTRLDGDYLLKLHESQQGELIFTLRDSAGVVLTEQVSPIEVLARNEWGGYGSSPELLAAFCMPNEPAVEKVLRATSDLLRRNGHDGTLHNYETQNYETAGQAVGQNADPAQQIPGLATSNATAAKRIWMQAAAVWNVLLALKLDYAYPPSSFERTGQKIRTPAAVLDSRRATCIDSSLLLASLCEQMQLHPLIILEQGHAYFGLWLKPEGFARPYTEDLLALRKRVQLKEIIVIETTLLCQGVPFKSALKQAEDRLFSDNSLFAGVVDIARARDERIRPLSFLDNPATPAEVLGNEISGGGSLELPSDTSLGGEAVEWGNASASPGGRLGQWQRKLLDLSLRNPLLNMRSSKTNIALVAPNPALLEDLLAQGKSMSIEAAPGHGSRDEEIHTQRTGAQLSEEIALTALARNKIYAQYDLLKLEAALVELYRKARNDLEEGGANTLFLAIGALHWQRPGVAERTYRAPLILIPVTITRQSVRSGIRITLNDDEPRFNTTLLEMLRQDFALDIKGLEGALPTDTSGTDIPAILTRLRQEVRDVAGFEVRDEVCLGTFSFAKYLMWKDLVDRTDKLKNNPVVRHLIDTPKEPFKELSEFVEPHSLDARLDPAEVFTPLSADSSQLAAVVAGAAGKNFVMIGPPGTGKSQTIANMIAHNLGLGRTILFVAEKSAALDVVYRRLREQGLGEFCLELHSNKARKLDILRQLGEAWEVRGKLAPEHWQDATGRLSAVRDDLNLLVKALHDVCSNGLTVRHALGIAAGMTDVPLVGLSWGSADQHDPASYERLLAVGERIALNAAEIGELNDHPLHLLHHADWSMAWQESVLQKVGELSSAAQAWQSSIGNLAARLQIQCDLRNGESLRALSTLVAALRASCGKDMAFAFVPNAKEILDAVGKVSELIKQFAGDTARLSCNYDRTRLLAVNLDTAQQTWQSAKRSWWLPRLIHSMKCRSYLQKEAGARAKPDPENDLPLLANLQVLSREIFALAHLLEAVPGWRILDSDTKQLTQFAQIANQLRTSMTLLAREADDLVALRGEVRKWVVDANEMLADDAALGAPLKNYQQLESALQQQLDQFAHLADQKPEVLLAMPDALAQMAIASERVQSARHKLNAWCAWRRARAEAVELGLQPIITAIEQGRVPAKIARQVIEVNYARWWIAQMIDATPALRQFVSVEHERKILNFRELDAQIRRITAEHIRTRIRAGLVEKESVKRSSEFGIIRRELEKKTRHKPLRQLISEAPTAIPMLTPCLLMSPLSIAQYLPVEQEPFDLVIFDEASQITVWDAIGAIARGKQTIVVGDPKQLPPTSFFSTVAPSNNEDADEEQEEDLESILDEMLGANLPTLNLSWHYRSRHESLITFSNHRYYKGGLVTFPSPVTQDSAVSMTFVEGIYERGSGQINRAEADAIVTEIERRLGDPVLSSQTLGVVTFNQKQQTLILDLLDAARRSNPELDKFFAEDLIEPVFVKNLESVQGDERDVIFFSTTFGPDQAGSITMNFGPLNKNGGERRLNVAITRARMELKVFSSLRADQIDLSRTAALGVRDLKHFLEFAEKGVRALGETLSAAQSDFASPLEAALARDLRAKGWTLHPQVGASRFRVDLGVVDPDAPGQYLAGIECDGTTYHGSATARDRDLVREGVLRGLGWNILRLWSTDYWLDPVGVVEKIDGQLRGIVEKRREAG